MHWMRDQDGNGVNLTHAFAIMAVEVHRNGQMTWELQARGGTWWTILYTGDEHNIKAIRESLVDELIGRTLDERSGR